MKRTGIMLAVACVIVGECAFAAEDWNQWRGPTHQGTLVGFKPPAEWPAELQRVWSRPVGIGHSSPLIVGDYVFLFSRESEKEVIRAIVLATGEERWKSSYPAPYEMHPAARGHGKGPKSTPLVADGRIYTLGISGTLSCLNTGSGKVLWRKDFKDRFKNTSPAFGVAASPVLDHGLLYVEVGGQDDGAILALDSTNGAERWKWTGDGPAYATPRIVTIEGVRQLVTQTQKMIVALDAGSGKLLWSLPFKTPYEQNIISPLMAGDRLIFAGLDQPTFALRVRKSGKSWNPEKLWESRDSIMYMSNPVADGRRLYGMSTRRGGQLFIVNAATGETIWLGGGRTGDNAAILDAGPDLLVETAGADLLVLGKRSDKLEELRRYHLAESPTWATPAVRDSYIAIKDQNSLSLWQIPRKSAAR